jgi:hypothetical protein
MIIQFNTEANETKCNKTPSTIIMNEDKDQYLQSDKQMMLASFPITSLAAQVLQFPACVVHNMHVNISL